MPTIAELRETYSNMLDHQLIQIAVHEAGDLIPAAVEVLHEELRKRHLAESLGLAVVAQTREWTPQEVEAMVNRVRQLPCPICGTTDNPLNVIRITTVRNFLVVTQRTDELVLGCPDCLERASRKASRACLPAMFLSPISAISTEMVNAKSRRALKVTEPTKAFFEFVLQNRGVVALLLKGEHGS